MPATSVPGDSRLSGLSAASIRAVVAAAQALDLGRVDAADQQIIGLLALHPDHPEVLRLLAGAQGMRGQAEAAVATMRRAVTLRPHDALYLNTLGTALITAGRYDEAIDILRQACALDPKLAMAWYNLGLALMRSMRVRESAVALRTALALSPDQVNARVILADMLKAEGDVEGAMAEYRAALQRQSYAGMAWWGLADIKTRRMSGEDIGSLRKALDHPRATDADRVASGFALAKALADAGHYAESLRALAQANALARQHQRWNATAHRAHVDSVIAAFTPAPAGAAQELGHEVIFVTSLPRSGSTLIEQVLASHPQVEGAGELPDLPMVLTEESQRRGQRFPLWVPTMRADDWARLGRRYLERTAHWRQRRPRFTDKLPYNWLYVGAIRAMLPQAHVIIGRRDPLETCLSCYRQHLVNNEYARDFADLAAFWRDFDRAVRHWLRLHPDHVHENVYEDLVARPEDRIRALLAACNLAFDPACLDFHATQRDVHTPSAAQVREPLRSDTARAARYGALLDPLRKELGLHEFARSAG